MPSRKKPQFIVNQEIARLILTDPGQRRRAAVGDNSPFLDREVTLRRHHEEENEEERQKVKNAWETISRDNLAEKAKGETPWKRVAIICDAGLGKTTNLWYFSDRLGDTDSLQMAYRLELAKLPHPTKLLEKIEVELRGRVGIDHLDVRWDLQKLRNEGRITLMLDSLDQLPSEPTARADILEQLVDLLNPTKSTAWANCPIWLTGRRYAFDEHWAKLLGAGGQWEILRVEPLDDNDVDHYYQRQHDRHLPRLAYQVRALLRTPRLLRLISGFTPERINRLNTPAAFYWEALTARPNPDQPGDGDSQGLIAAGLVGEAEKLGLSDREIPSAENLPKRIQRACELLGATAFEMFAESTPHTPQDEVPRPNLAYIPEEQLLDFEDAVKQRVLAAGRGSASDFDYDYLLLKKMNAGQLDYQLLQDGGEKNLKWHNATVQAFFAAYWVCRHGSDKDLQAIARWLVQPYDEQTEVFREFWLFATEMPPAALGRDPSKWQKVMAPLYDVSLQPSPTPIRSCEFIYRSWDRMNGTEAQKKFLAEFPAIHAGKHGKRSQHIAQTMIQGFVLLAAPNSKLPGDTGEFLMGSPEGEAGSYGDEQLQYRARVQGPFEIHRFCVTNLEYELFDESHQYYRWYGHRDDNDDDCPVVRVNWYDAWCFAAWCGCRLPSEIEWEYACRAGTTTRYHFGNEMDEHLGNYGNKVGRTMPVGTYKPNAWGLYDMHGNVWEWCLDWYDGEIYAARHSTNLKSGAAFVDSLGGDVLSGSYRVHRGGSWLLQAENCLAACRDYRDPGSSNYNLGLRLARVPSSQ